MVTTTASAQKKQQKQAQQWQKRMMTRAHQWEAEDLEFAGLNRILTATGGSPQSFSTPTSAPRGEGGEIAEMINNAVSTATSSARSAATMQPERQVLQAQKKMYDQETQKKKNETTLIHGQEELLREQMPYLVNSARYNSLRDNFVTQIQGYQIPGWRAMHEAQSTQKYKDALKFEMGTSGYTRPFQNMLNLNMGGALIGGPRRK